MLATHLLMIEEPTSTTRKLKDNCITLTRRVKSSNNRAAKMNEASLKFTCLISLMSIGLLLVLQGPSALNADEQQAPKQPASGELAVSNGIRSTQPTVDRQVDAPNSSPIVSAPSVSQASAPQVGGSATGKAAAPETPASSNKESSGPAIKANKPKPLSGSQKKAAALASQQNYDKYQLKATNSYQSQTTPAAASAAASSSGSDSANSNSNSDNNNNNSPANNNGAKVGKDEQVDKMNGAKVAGNQVAYKKSSSIYSSQQGNNNNNQNNKAKSSFSLLKKLLPSFMSSAAGPMAAAAAAAASAVVDKHQVSHSRSSQSAGLMAGGGGGSGMLSKASGKIINLLSSSSKKSANLGSSSFGAVPDHAPFFIRKPSIDRQAGFASGLLSNPLSLGLLFSAPLIPSLLLTPLAIAGLSPAMSAINNFFGDDEEASTPASSPLSVLTGPSSALSSILQGSSSPLSTASGQGSSPSSSLALQAVQSFLGPPATTEKPLFNPGMFASQGIQNAVASLSSGASGSSSSSSSSSSSLSGSSSLSSAANNSPIRNFLGGNLIQTAASMISPSFAAPPSGGSSSSSSSSSSSGNSNSDSDDGPGFMQVASDVFDKVANYMSPDKDIAPASNPGITNSGSSSSSSPLSALVNLSNFSPFQLSSLLASSPFGSAVAQASPSSSSSGSSSSGSGSGAAGTTQRAGFFSTLKNVYELFSSSFLRRQEVGDSNECQQRLICELHQRAMNSKLFRRSVQSNLMELANLDKSLQEQIKSNPIQARVDAGTKAMLNDFLKATNNFKNGRELVNCSKMFPKCSRAMLLSTANAHLTDPNNSKAIGKFSSLMKKMKFKSNQQHQSQWKLRKPAKSNGIQSARAVPAASQQYQASDYLQVAPLSIVPNGADKSQLTPVDSLKLVQQIMSMSQQQQQQQQQQQPQYQASQQIPQFTTAPQQFNQQQYGQPNQMYNVPQGNSYAANYAQYQNGAQNGQTMQSNMYSDGIVSPVYSSTDSPYFIPPQQQPVATSPDLSMLQVQPQLQQQQAQQQQHSQIQHQSVQSMSNQQQVLPQIQQNYQQQYPSSTSTTPEHVSMNVDNKSNKMQQQHQGVPAMAAAA